MTKNRVLNACFSLLLTFLFVPNSAEAQTSTASEAKVWPSQPPAGIPFAPSTEITGLAFTGQHAHYGHADTWYPSWAANGNMYSPWTDGEVNGVTSNSTNFKGNVARTGYATIHGDDPMHLEVTDAAVYPSTPEPYEGRYPSANLFYKGVWYYGTYCVHQDDSKHMNWEVIGPFVGFRYATDHGKSWTQTKHTPAHPLFPEPDHFLGKIKIGAPHFVDFGQELQNSPDGKAYLVAHGSTNTDPNQRADDVSWITGNEIYLARVKPSIKNIDDASKYEYFAGHDKKGKAIWTHDFSHIKPVVKWNNNMGCVTITYDASLKKYLMAVTDGGTTISKYNTYILESSDITGPWKLVTYMKEFGEEAYFVNFPSKFISKDGRTAWLSYSANFANGFAHTDYKSIPEGSDYWWTLQEVHLLDPNETK